MMRAIVQSKSGLTLIGGGPVGRPALKEALSLAPRVVAADGGARRALALGAEPEAVIGDLDSLDARTRAALPPERIHHVAEQDSTDFDKALRHVSAPFCIGVGFWGARMDHGLAAINALARHPDRRCLLLGGREVCFLCPPELELHLRPGSRFSLFPLGPVTGESEGLEWPIDGLDFAPDGRVGTSNRVSAPRVRLRMSAPRMLVLLPSGALREAVRALAPDAAPAAARGE
ncbi:thiamine diphosphokinase [Acidimangrovimonas sediminis]|uniref:thiamine diphosphokinase n=1 Tax=Acidimangrovimonas sediminis TaxID=2056283 RepID=UPI000C7F9C79|nr:thiamine diphosphokinase [Acidimangrovimonas sediminis]